MSNINREQKRSNNDKSPRSLIGYVGYHFLLPAVLLIVLLVVLLAFSTAVAVGVTMFLSRFLPGLSDGQMSLIAGITQSCAAIISICLLVYQLKDNAKLNEQQRNIDEAQFVLQYNRVFIENRDMAYVERRLERFAYIGAQGNKPLINNKNRQYFINYLVYFEGLALSILKGEVSLERIDDLMGYRFFLLMNNPDVWQKELQVFPDYYRGCIVLYKKWKKHRKDLGKPIPQEKYSLDVIWDKYSSIAEEFSPPESKKHGINFRKK